MYIKRLARWFDDFIWNSKYKEKQQLCINNKLAFIPKTLRWIDWVERIKRKKNNTSYRFHRICWITATIVNNVHKCLRVLYMKHVLTHDKRRQWLNVDCHHEWLSINVYWVVGQTSNCCDRKMCICVCVSLSLYLLLIESGINETIIIDWGSYV